MDAGNRGYCDQYSKAKRQHTTINHGILSCSLRRLPDAGEQHPAEIVLIWWNRVFVRSQSNDPFECRVGFEPTVNAIFIPAGQPAIRILVLLAHVEEHHAA